MDISTMRALIRRDLKDEDAADYTWTDDEIDRHIVRALAELSRAVPREMKSTIATEDNSREIDVSTLTDRISISRVEFPIDRSPRIFQRFAVYGDTVTLIGDYEGDGDNCYIYWSKVHTLDTEGSTVPTYLEDVLALGAAGYAAMAQGRYSVNRANTGGENVDRNYCHWGREMLKEFREKLKQHGRKHRLKVGQLYEGTDCE